MTGEWNGKERRTAAPEYAHVAGLERRMERFETALFALTAENEFGRPGLVVTADRLDAHLDTICRVARWFKATVLGLLAGGASLAAIGKHIGWW